MPKQRMRSIVFNERSRAEILHIEIPGAVVSVHVGLRDSAGHKIVHVSVDVCGDRYAGDPEWWGLPTTADSKGVGIRIARLPKAEAEKQWKAHRRGGK